VGCAAISSDGKLALSGCLGMLQGNTFRHDNSPRSLRLFDVESGKLVRELHGHTGNIWGVAFAPDGHRAVSCGEDNTVRLWNVDTGKEIRRFNGHTAAILCVVFTPDGKRFITGSRDHTIRLWNVETGQELRRFDGHRDAVTSLSLSRDGQFVLSGSLDRTARLWKLTSSDKPVVTVKAGAGAPAGVKVMDVKK
jgi:WD40 repeat protein